MDDKVLSTLNSLISQVKIVQASDVVYKDQCFYSFDTPDSPLGIFVNLVSFYCYGHQFVRYYFEKTGYRLYLNIRRNMLENVDCSLRDQADTSLKPTKLGIGVEGGFLPHHDKYTISEQYYLVLLPEFLYIPLTSKIPSLIHESILSIIDKSSDIKIDSFDSWEQKLFVSKHSETLIQLNCDERILPSGWKCSKCQMTENLWLNLTDGSILCGRRQFDGSGGNNHALEHYSLTKYPLSVKLGTITPNGGDVFSYDEDDMVIDSNLSNHLAHYGINISSMHKTDKTMNELQIDLNIQIGEASIIQESDSELKPIFGSGYIGLNNLGNSCYINSVIQVLFSIPHFYKYFYSTVDYLPLFEEKNLIFDLVFQLKKLARGIYFREYSLESSMPISHIYDAPPGQLVIPKQVFIDNENNAISLWHFRTSIGRGHREFSSYKQQDAHEFLLYLLNTIDKNLLSSKSNPCDIFRFKIQDRLECLQTHHVQYSIRNESILSLAIPNMPSTSLSKVSEQVIIEENSKNINRDTSQATFSKVQVSIMECLQGFQTPHIISDFLSPVTHKYGNASKTSTFSTFPEYLFIHFGKFYVGDDWVPKKLDVEISGTENLLDIEFLRSPNVPTCETGMSSNVEQIDLEILEKLLEVGCDETLSKKALTIFDNDFESALSWVLNPESSLNVENPHSEPDKSLIESLTDFGFTNAQSVYALRKTGNNVERAVDYLFSHNEEISSILSSENLPQIDIPDGTGHYTLVSIISHIGSSTMCGHYVAHTFKEGKWVLFNDDKVTESKNPPFKLGYLYLYKRYSDNK